MEYSSHQLEKDALIGSYSECPYKFIKHATKHENLHVNGTGANLEYRSTPDVQHL